ncbi:MAG: CBS domain-containing protein [Oscillospiraceae bacterium]|nr:CBS domain-containing protein [Oscillospiraceae bacterium]
MQVREIMTDHVVSITPEESAALAARLLARYNLGALPVCEGDGKLRGIVTDRDIVVRCVAAQQDPGKKPVGEIMSEQVESVAPGDDVRKATERMSKNQIRRLPVVEDGKLIGMLSLGDIATDRACTMEAAEALSEISDNCRSAD